MARDDKYSRFIARLKVVLPLFALSILSTLFLVAETLDPEAAIPFAEVDVDRIMDAQGVTRPSFGGVSTNGSKIALTADVVRPDDGVFLGETLDLRIDLPNGAEISVVSPEGTVDMVAQEAVLTGGVEMQSSAGYDLTTSDIRTNWNAGILETDSAVVATGPGGRIDAGQMRLTQDTGTGAHLLVFKGGVRLLYEPQS